MAKGQILGKRSSHLLTCISNMEVPWPFQYSCVYIGLLKWLNINIPITQTEKLELSSQITYSGSCSDPVIPVPARSAGRPLQCCCSEPKRFLCDDFEMLAVTVMCTHVCSFVKKKSKFC